MKISKLPFLTALVFIGSLASLVAPACSRAAEATVLICSEPGAGVTDTSSTVDKLKAPSGNDKAKPYVPPAKTTDAGPDSDLAWLRNPEDKAKSEALNYANLMPLLQERYGKRKELNVLEIGPLRTTSVAHALTANTKLYQGLDISKNAVLVQQENLDKEGLTNAKSLVGDIYNLPLPNESQDLVFASRTTPLGSIHATRESLTRAYSEIARVLKPGGEFVLYPEPRKEIRAFDPSGEIFRELKRIRVAPNPGNKDESWMIIFDKR